MNDLQKELQELKAKVAELESRIVAEPVKWQPKGGDWCINPAGEVVENLFSHIGILCFGTERATQAQAQRASVEMRRFNRLLALRDELCGDEVVNWLGFDKYKYHLFFSHNQRAWFVSSDLCCENIMPYFTNYDSAQKACDMLNSGEVEL